MNIFSQSVLSIMALLTGRMVCYAGTETTGTRPNFLIIMIDDLGYGDPGSFGGYTPTPNIDKLFQSGMVMNNFMVTPLSSPTRASLLTGCNPLRLNQGPYVDGVLSTSITTFGSAFQNQGYKTGIFGKWHNSVAPIFNPSMPDVNEYGFDEWFGGYGGGFDFFTKIWPNNFSAPCWFHNDKHIADNRDYATNTLTDYAIRFMEANQTNNFLCYLPYTAMHEPIHVREEDLAKVPYTLVEAAGGLRPWKEYYKLINSSNFQGRLYKGYVQLTGDRSMDSIEGKLNDADMRILYAAMLINLDENVGRLLTFLKESGLENNTVVWFFSDNGGELRNWVNNKPLRGSKHTIFEGGIHSRAVVRWPAIGWNVLRSFNGLMGSQDIYPTCMDMAGFPVPNPGEIDGKSCFKAMKKGKPTPVNAYYYLWEGSDAIRTPQWKLFRYGDHTELYDMNSDLYETTDVADKFPKQVSELIKKLDAWMKGNKITAGHIPQVVTQFTAEQPHRNPLEVKFNQISPVNLPNGSMVQLLNFKSFPIQTGDQLEYDILFSKTSRTDGGHMTVRRGTGRPLFLNRAVDQYGKMFSANYTYDDATEKWVHIVVGMGHGCPEGAGILGFLITGSDTGAYHFYLDNVVVRRRDGSNVVIWQQGMPVSGVVAPEEISDLQVGAVSTATSKITWP